MEITPWPGDTRYGVTRDGRVFRIKQARFGRHVPFEMTRRLDRDGYFLVGSTMKVHRLVAETYIPNPTNLPQVAHYNGVRNDNRVENLRWDTVKGNSVDRIRHGTMLEGEASPMSKLTERQVVEARVRAAGGESHTSIAADMPVDRSVLSRAIRGDTWDHV